MRNNLFKAKRQDNREWVTGYLMDENYINVPFNDDDACGRFDEEYEIDTSTVCMNSGLMDVDAFENDIFEYIEHGYGTCMGVVKYGIYEQDGSGGEYRSKECIGFYVEKVRLIPSEGSGMSVEESEEYFPQYLLRQSLMEVIKYKEGKRLGNVFDNGELLMPENITHEPTAREE